VGDEQRDEAGRRPVQAHPRSSISGRLIQVVVDSQGASRDVAYVSEEARTFYLKVESANEDWKFTVDEGFSATIEPKH
jgi:hypothetical protein